MPISQFSPAIAAEEELYWRQPIMNSTPPSKHKPNAPSTAQIYAMSRASLINFKEQELDQQTISEEEREEEMFEKPLTPSDVGKLNRLVIPKQHAEKYFPLGGSGRVDSPGSLLSFEDESGKSWRFRYSYWNSSQSYVLTKGWSRFVKEKQLDAGDVVSFHRRRRRFFIRWRRGSGLTTTPVITAPPPATWTQLTTTNHLLHHPPLHYSDHHYNIHAGVAVEPVVETQQRGGWKRLRLFGVNLECQLDETEPAGSSQGQTHLLYSQAHGSSHA